MQERVKRPKRAVNLSIDADLLAEAKAAGTNLSGVLETALRDALKEQRRQKWLERNSAALERDAAELERNGPWHTPEWLAK